MSNYYGYPSGTPQYPASYQTSYAAPAAPAPAPVQQSYPMAGYAAPAAYNYPTMTGSAPQPPDNSQQMSNYSYPAVGGPTAPAAPTAYYAAPVPNITGVYQASPTKSMQPPAPQQSQSTSVRQTSQTSVVSDTTTYSGYDAAVYAAAKTYLEHKSTTETSTWASMKKSGSSSAYASSNNTTIETSTNRQQTGGGGGAGRFGGANRFGGGKPGYQRKGGQGSYGGGYQQQQQQQHYCEVCKISCGAMHTYRDHLEGKMHKKKAELAKSGGAMANKPKGAFVCEVCDVTCTGTDAYQAHIRGAKHMKILKLQQQLGKVIPPVANYGADMEPKKIVAVPKMNFVGGEKLTSTGISAKSDENGSPMLQNKTQAVAEIDESDNVQPVGEDYLEVVKIEGGRVTAFNCKLCDCRFTDLNAKDMHMKGRRHRLNYKKKVDPQLEVDVKLTPKLRRHHEEKVRRDLMRIRQADIYSMRALYQSNMSVPTAFGSLMSNKQSASPFLKNTVIDRYIISKHMAISPTPEETSKAQNLVNATEKALKLVSDQLTDTEKARRVTIGDISGDLGATEDRVLKGVMRVGDLAKQLLLKGDTLLELVVLCADAPTVNLLHQVATMLPEKFQREENKEQHHFIVTQNIKDAAIFVKSDSEPRFELKITFTSVVVRELELGESANESTAPDVLDKHKCLEALASLRHAKWFQARCASSHLCLIVLRILKDLRQRVALWAALRNWQMELLVEKCLNCNSPPSTASEALRRFFEGVASGILFKSGPGLLDPCEKTTVDALAYLTGQQREDMTACAQHYLRLMAFGQIYTVLGVDKKSEDDSSTGQRKRPHDADDFDMKAEESNGKKDRKGAS